MANKGVYREAGEDDKNVHSIETRENDKDLHRSNVCIGTVLLSRKKKKMRFGNMLFVVQNICLSLIFFLCTKTFDFHSPGVTSPAFFQS